MVDVHLSINCMINWSLDWVWLFIRPQAWNIFLPSNLKFTSNLKFNSLYQPRSWSKALSMKNSHHYRVELYYTIINMQLHELNRRFDEVNSKWEVFGFILFSISCPSPYKRCANPPMNMWNHMWDSTDLMVDLQNRCTKDGKENDTNHISFWIVTPCYVLEFGRLICYF